MAVSTFTLKGKGSLLHGGPTLTKDPFVGYTAQISSNIKGALGIDGEMSIIDQVDFFFDSDGWLDNPDGIKLPSNDPGLNLEKPLAYHLRVISTGIPFTAPRTVVDFWFLAGDEGETLGLDGVTRVGKFQATGTMVGRRGLRTRAVPVDPGDPDTLWQWVDELGVEFGDPVALTDILDINAAVNQLAANLTANPESNLNAAMGQVALNKLAAGAPNLMTVVDARGNPSIARPSWLGPVMFQVNRGDAPPIHAGDAKDIVWPIATEELPWTPWDLPGKLHWYNADELNLEDGDLVDLWPDSWHNGDLLQETSGFRPTYVLTGMAGERHVHFDGINDYLRGTVINPYASPFIDFLLVRATKADNTGGSDYFIGDSTSGVNAGAIYRTSDQAYGMARGSSLSAANDSWDNSIQLLEVVFNGATSSLKANNVTNITGATGVAAGNVQMLTMGGNAALSATSFAEGDIAQRIRVSTLSSDDRTKLITWFSDKYDLGLV